MSTAHRIGGGLRLALLLSALAALGGSPAPAGKKLIEFGWDEPDPRFMRAHIAEMQASPFDGCVFHVDYHAAAGDSGSFTWQLWSRRRFTAQDLAAASADLRATKFGRFRDNFLRVNVTPGDLDWFEPHDAVMANLELAARLAKQSGGPGVLFDIEQYRDSLWDFRVQTRTHAHTWEELSAQVRKRGAEAMRALERGYPGLTVFMSLAYSLPLHETHGGHYPLTGVHNGLLLPFLEGMLSAASGRTSIVDGHELSYAYREPERFAAKADSMRHGAMRLTAQPARYAQRLSAGFGIWLDNDWARLGWNAEDPSRNYFTPAAFAVAVQAALDHTDRYVWIYTEKARWWGPNGRPQALPAAYDSVLRHVRR